MSKTLGTDTLSATVEEFRETGYLVVPELVSKQEAARLWATFDEFGDGPVAGDKRIFYNERVLVRERGFVDALLEPRLVEHLREIVGHDFQLLAYDGPQTNPAEGALRGWHLELPIYTPVEQTLAVNVGMYLQDMVDEAGPLCIIPGSHLWQRPPTAEERPVELPDELKLRVPAGTGVIIHGALWHSASPNHTDRPRRAVFAYIGPYWMKRMDEYYRDPLPAYILESNDPLVRQLFGLELRIPGLYGTDYAPDNPRWW